jgi:uncharacterized protein YoxC
VEILTVVQIIALISLSALAIASIFFVKNILSSIRNIEKDVNLLVSKASPVFENLSAITHRVNSMTESIETQINDVLYSINSLKEIISDVVRFEKRIQRRVEEPVLDAVSFFSALIKGVKTFILRFRQ